jgi:hypothetical protein
MVTALEAARAAATATADRVRSLPAPRRSRVCAWALGALLLPTAIYAVPTGSIDTQFVGARGRESLFRPASPASGVSDGYVFHATEGLFRTFDRSGALLGSATSKQFWTAAGLDDIASFSDVAYNPRIVFDPGSQRFFASQGWYRPAGSTDVQGSSLLLAVSKTSNPLDGFTALRIGVADGGSYAAWPNLGVSGDSVTLTTATYESFTSVVTSGVSVYTFAKADLLGTAPATAEVGRLEGYAVADVGFRLQPASGVVAGPQTLLGSDGRNSAFGSLFRTDLVGTGSDASLAPQANLVGLYDGFSYALQQPGNVEVTTDRGDLSSGLYQVGDFIYFTRTVGNANGGLPTDATTSYVAWGILRVSTNEVVAEGLVGTPGRTNGYAAIAANSDGRFVVSYNGSSSTRGIGAYAVVCDFDFVAAATCGSEIEVRPSVALPYLTSSPGDSRWGEYSAIQVDPLDPTAFWLTQAVPYSPSVGTFDWMTVITRLVTSPLDIGGGGGGSGGTGGGGGGGATDVPEPSTLSLAALGLLGAWLQRRRRSSAAAAS